MGGSASPACLALSIRSPESESARPFDGPPVTGHVNSVTPGAYDGSSPAQTFAGRRLRADPARDEGGRLKPDRLIA